MSSARRTTRLRKESSYRQDLCQNKRSHGSTEESMLTEEQDYASSSGDEESVAKGVVRGNYRPQANQLACLKEDLARVQAERDAEVNENISLRKAFFSEEQKYQSLRRNQRAFNRA